MPDDLLGVLMLSNEMYCSRHGRSGSIRQRLGPYSIEFEPQGSEEIAPLLYWKSGSLGKLQLLQYSLASDPVRNQLLVIAQLLSVLSTAPQILSACLVVPPTSSEQWSSPLCRRRELSTLSDTRPGRSFRVYIINLFLGH